MAKQAQKLRLTLVKSLIGRLQKHKDSVRCLGLGRGRVNSSVVVEATPSTLGMIDKVAYLLKIEEVA